MFGLGPATRIYLAAGATDMRKGFEGLYGLVRDRLLCEPLSGHLFLFCNAQRNRPKILYWDGTGLWVCASTCAYERRLRMPARGTKTGSLDENINLRASQNQKALIDRAADAPGRSRVGFHARDGVPGTLSRIKSPGDNSAVIFQFPLRSYVEAMGG
ncbi:MAG: IS66 family insertion sequence element accessory protein TnpB [Candidatus Sulfotelmatobacter sp.]